MEGIPVLGFAGYSGSGKTTLIEKLIPILTGAGLRLAVAKHDAHGFTLDREGKDTARFAAAGAAMTLITFPAGTACMEGRGRTLEELLAWVRDVDLVLVEGWKGADISQIGVCRPAAGIFLPDRPERYLAVASDSVSGGLPVPEFALNDAEGVAAFIMEHREDFTHFNDQGRARMVDVGDKAPTRRTASAGVRVLVNRGTFELIRSGGVKKGDVLTVAQIAGIMGAKRTPDLIPMCHPVVTDGIDLSLTLDEGRCSVEITATVSCAGRTGVEMEALTAASTAALTVYDMCKAVQRDMVITDLRLLAKAGGIHGDYRREEEV